MIRTVLGATALCLTAGISSAATITFSSSLTGAQEVPPVTTSAFGSARFTVDDVTQELGLTLDVTGISVADLADGFVAGPLGPVHLHEAPRGSNGPIVIPFAFDAATYTDTTTGFSLNVEGYSFADAVALTGSTDPFDVFVAGLQAGTYYLNVHTDTFGSGEIRGQVSPVPLPAGIVLMLTGLGALGAVRRRRKAA